jgi:hypothetical protein
LSDFELLIFLDLFVFWPVEHGGGAAGVRPARRLATGFWVKGLNVLHQ